ncbi:MAG: hypothetical protein IPK28_00010 [Devosia sp.]|nr:hypothetical protein [Devosia sp.]
MPENAVLAKLKKLDEERAKLIADAKSQALAAANMAIADLNSLGFTYRLVEGGVSTPRAPSSGTRRAGIRELVLNAVRASGADGINRADLLLALGMKGDKSGEQSVSNALSALKKAGATSTKNGRYVAA